MITFERIKAMFGFDYDKNLSVGRVGLEISLKPFKKLDDEYIEKVCDELFDQWTNLLHFANGCSVMLWSADGSEILEYTGDLDDKFEWCYFVGLANWKTVYKHAPDDILQYGRKYLPDGEIPNMTYGALKKIISAIKMVGKKKLGFDIEVGATFDPGPEFSLSDFKTRRHPEIDCGNGEAAESIWYHCAGNLNGDSEKYAAYPDGIPDGLCFGTFFGKQFERFKNDLGFDYIWLSNGFGYSLRAWNWTGEGYNGKCFCDGENKVINGIKEFWSEFTKYCDCRIETRGSNITAGMDIGAHASPIKDIYSEYNVVAPPNSPWAALDFRYGLELSGYMSHIAVLPEKNKEFMFRYYLNDPWWKNSPWFDRYRESPHDIYLPLAIGRIDENGKVQNPKYLNFLTCDDTYGKLSWQGASEVTPHILSAYNHAPNKVGFVTWVYPFDYYEQGAKTGRNGEAAFSDWAIESALDNGLSISSVVADRNILKTDLSIYKDSVLLMPVPNKGTYLEKILIALLENSCSVMLYGDVRNASDMVRNLIGVNLADGIDGRLKMHAEYNIDTLENGEFADTFEHVSHLSNGDINTVSNGNSEVLAYVCDEKNRERVYASYSKNALSGRLVWIRASFPHKNTPEKSLPEQKKRSDEFCVSSLFRRFLSVFGIKIAYNFENPNGKCDMLAFAKKDNALYISGASSVNGARAKVMLPDGAPLVTNCPCSVDENGAEYDFNMFMHGECLVYVKQKERTKVSVVTVPCSSHSLDKRIRIFGLKDAHVTFCAPKKPSYTRFLYKDETDWVLQNMETKTADGGKKVIAEHISETLTIGWRID